MKPGGIRCISLHTPWSAFCELGLKGLETRSWSTPYRGLLAIHTARTSAHIDEARPLFERAFPGRPLLPFGLTRSALEARLGKIVAVAELVDCFRAIEPAKELRGEKGGLVVMVDAGTNTEVRAVEVARHEFILGNLYSDPPAWRWGWRLENIRALREPVPVRGRQGLWTLEPEVAARVMAQLEPAGAPAVASR